MTRKIWWTDFSASEFDNLDPEKTIAIVPIAAVEQHGPHLPVGTDMILNQGCLDLLVQRAPAALDRTIRELSPVSEVAIASGRLNARKSDSGSGRSARNGSTTRRVSGCASAVVLSLCTPSTSSSSLAIASADGGRCGGRLASARRSTRSMATTAGEPVSAGGCS